MLEDLGEVDVLDRGVELGEVCGRDHRLQVGERVPASLLAHDPELLLLVGVAERRLQEEAVELRLRERERAFLLDRVLGRDQQEGRRELARHAVDRHLTLCHGFEQRGLRLRHRAVDLVDEHDVREDRPGPELEVARLLVVDREPGDVGRLQVGRALDARADRAFDALRDRAREHGLRRAGNVLEEHVAARRERGEHEPDLLALPVDDGLHVREQACGDVDGAFEPDADRLLVDPWRGHSRHPRARTSAPDLS